MALFDSQYWREKKQVRRFEIKHGQLNVIRKIKTLLANQKAVIEKAQLCLRLHKRTSAFLYSLRTKGAETSVSATVWTPKKKTVVKRCLKIWIETRKKFRERIFNRKKDRIIYVILYDNSLLARALLASDAN